MLWINLTGVKPYDGRYEFDVPTTEFSTYEWGWIKRFAGYLPLTINEGWDGGDPQLFAVFALIALYRAGRITAKDAPDVFDRIGAAPFGSTIRLENDQADEDEEAEDASPPVPSSPESTNTFGGGSTTSSEPPTAAIPDGSGIPDSDTSASTPIRLAT